MSTAREICASVPRSILDSPVSDIHLSDICSHIMEWQELAPYLDLSEVDENDIITRYQNRPKLQRREALRRWREINGKKASYRKLICILCTQGRVHTAEYLRDLACNTSEGDADGIISNIRKYLSDCYSTETHHPSPLQWPFFANTSFFDLNLYDVPVILRKGQQFQTPLSLNAIFTAGKKNAIRKVILVEGVAGCGKSTLCWFACREWAEGRLFQDIKLLIHVSLSDKAIKSATVLADIIPHPSKELREAVTKAITDKGGKGICFFLDGCDESYVVFTKGSFLSQFIAGTGSRSKLPEASILLTSRPSGIPLDLLTFVTGKVIIKGFKSLDHFINVTISEDSMKKSQLFEALEMKPKLYSLCYLPLHAVILVHIFDFLKEKLPSTHTELFHPLVCNFLIRHMQTRTEFGTKQIKNLSTDLPPTIYSSLCRVSQLAYQSIIDGKTSLSPGMLKAAGINPQQLLNDTFGLLQVQHSITMYGPTNTCTFQHLSLQEFLAAFHITQLSKDGQLHAFEAVFKQNPLSLILSFYAGLTRLHSEDISNLLCQVIQKPLDLPISTMFFPIGDPALDPRKQLLALMNCVYESQNVEVIKFNCISSYSGDPDKRFICLTNSYGCHSLCIPIKFMQLYPTEFLALGYFIRHTSHVVQRPVCLTLDLTGCLLRTKEIKALSLELCKPVEYAIRKQSLLLNISLVHLTNEALFAIRKLMTSHSGLIGLEVTGYMIKNIQLALKYLTENLNNSDIKHLRIVSIYTISPTVHHFVLLLTYCRHLETLDLSDCSDVFKYSRMMPIFCEALKHSNLQSLSLLACKINDWMLQFLAIALTNGCKLTVLDTRFNPYTPQGLTCFLKTLVKNAARTDIIHLSLNHFNNEHCSLVEQFNMERKKSKANYFKLNIDFIQGGIVL